MNIEKQPLKLPLLSFFVSCHTQKTAGEEKLASHFSEIVRGMEDYLNPLLSQFNFSCLR